MKRRKFLQAAGYTAAAAYIPAQLRANQPDVAEPGGGPASPMQQTSVLVKDNKVFIETQTLSAIIEKGPDISQKQDQREEFIEKPDINNSGLCSSSI